MLLTFYYIFTIIFIIMKNREKLYFLFCSKSTNSLQKLKNIHFPKSLFSYSMIFKKCSRAFDKSLKQSGELMKHVTNYPPLSYQLSLFISRIITLDDKLFPIPSPLSKYKSKLNQSLFHPFSSNHKKKLHDEYFWCSILCKFSKLAKN